VYILKLPDFVKKVGSMRKKKRTAAAVKARKNKKFKKLIDYEPILSLVSKLFYLILAKSFDDQHVYNVKASIKTSKKK